MSVGPDSISSSEEDNVTTSFEPGPDDDEEDGWLGGSFNDGDDDADDGGALFGLPDDDGDDDDGESAVVLPDDDGGGDNDCPGIPLPVDDEASVSKSPSLSDSESLLSLVRASRRIWRSLIRSRSAAFSLRAFLPIL